MPGAPSYSFPLDLQNTKPAIVFVLSVAYVVLQLTVLIGDYLICPFVRSTVQSPAFALAKPRPFSPTLPLEMHSSYPVTRTPLASKTKFLSLGF